MLPVGCGKSGLIALAPFSLQSKRTLIVAPNLNIADQLFQDLNPSNPKHFYTKRRVLINGPYPEPAEIRGTKSNLGDLHEADVVVTNIQQLQRENNRWLTNLPGDFFDLIEFDEAHHNVAESWEVLRAKFPKAKIVNVSATPARADGRLMAGKIIYSYPISEAVRNGYVKRVNGHRLNPTTLRYVRRDGSDEITVDFDEVRRLGETDASFRRSIVSSEETLTTIVDASIQKLRDLRTRSGEKNLKIIASALNMEHCKQVVAKYKEKGLRADFVHSGLNSKENDKVYGRLEGHELDVIVQVRKLGEGFDHPYLAVAAIFSLFSNLSPFMQFVGRIMRIIPDSDPQAEVNEGVVVFHVGGNITGVWNDFKEFADADQEFFANLVDETVIEGSLGEPRGEGFSRTADSQPLVIGQEGLALESIPLLAVDDPAVKDALDVLLKAGIANGSQFEELQRIQPTKQAARQANRTLLDELVKTKAGAVLAKRSISNVGFELDKTRRGKSNFQVVKSAVDLKIKVNVPSGATARNEYSASDLTTLTARLPEFVSEVEREIFGG